jgi:hypothetical protein
MGRITTVTPTFSELYPVVHDLTEAEYGKCGGGGNLAGGGVVMLGKFSLQELARPNIHPRRLPHDDHPSTSSQNGALDKTRKRQRRHSRTPSLLQLMSSHFSSMSHSSCFSPQEAVDVPMESEREEEDEDRIVQGPSKTISFDDVFVLTRQVSFRPWKMDFLPVPSFSLDGISFDCCEFCFWI